MYTLDGKEHVPGSIAHTAPPEGEQIFHSGFPGTPQEQCGDGRKGCISDD